MPRGYNGLALSTAMTTLLLMMFGVPSLALSLYWPKPDQIVRENVKISIPGKAVPNDCFVTVAVGEEGKENFVLAVNTESVRAKDGTINIFWNSKAPYRTISEVKEDRFFKDGKYSIRIDIHKQGQSSAKIIDSASVPVVLKNKVARPNPAPGISLVNRLSFGQTNTYDISSNVQVFEVVAGVALPIAGGLGMSGEFKVIQSVEDVRGDGDYLLRYRIADDPTVTQFGQKTTFYENDEIKPQLYRLMNKYGDVTNKNMFSKQAKFSITDVLPVLPKKVVKEGDSWPDRMSLKLEGLTDTIDLGGTCSLDSFEWQNGRECVKLISEMAGNSSIALAEGKIRSANDIVKAEIITYFDYRNSKLIRRDVVLDFPAVVEPGAGDVSRSSTGDAVPPTRGAGYGSSSFGDNGAGSAGAHGRSRSRDRSTYGGQSSGTTKLKKGTVQIRASFVLVK